MKKRTLYFLYDRLQITSAERKMIYLLTTFVLLLFAVKPFAADTQAFDETFYQPLYNEFEILATINDRENERLLARYFPDTIISEPESLNKEPKQEAVPDKKNNTETASQAVNKNEATELLVILDEPININKATAEELTQLPGIGPAIAARIIEYRDTNGPFDTIEEIKNVRGIGEVRYEAIKELITV